MLPFVLAALITASAMDKPGPKVVSETSVENIAKFPPSPVSQPATEEVIKVCTINFLEEVDQMRTGQQPQQILIYAEAEKLTQLQTQQIMEYCKAYSAGAAFVVSSVAVDATITDILARSRVPIIPSKGTTSK